MMKWSVNEQMSSRSITTTSSAFLSRAASNASVSWLSWVCLGMVVTSRIKFVSLDIALYGSRYRAACMVAAPAGFPDGRRRDRLLHERQIENPRGGRKSHLLILSNHAMRSQIFTKREARPMNHREMRQREQRAIALPGLEVAIHIGPEHEEKFSIGILGAHPFERIHGVTLFELIHLNR